MTTGNGKSTRQLRSWIDAYLEYTKDTPAPEIFRLWTAIGTIGAAVERRGYCVVSNETTYPNMFILLVGQPGVGKSNAIRPANTMMEKTKLFHLAPEDTSKASLLQWIASDECRDRLEIKGVTEEHHVAALFLSEFGVFVKEHDLELLSALCRLFDSPDHYKNKRVYQGKEPLNIPRPQVSILAGTQPGYLASRFPVDAWGQGFMARVFLVYSGEPARPSLFKSKPLDQKLESQLVRELIEIKKVQGKFIFAQETQDLLEAWYGVDGSCTLSGKLPAPTFPRLKTYNTRRIVHMLKLCMISSVSRDNSLIVSPEDFESALDWMYSAEKEMPNVFKEMSGRNDLDTIRELWHYAWTKYMYNKKALSHANLMSQLASKLPAFQAEKVLLVAFQSGFFRKDDAGAYIPQAKQVWDT